MWEFLPYMYFSQDNGKIEKVSILGENESISITIGNLLVFAKESTDINSTVRVGNTDRQSPRLRGTFVGTKERAGWTGVAIV
jgi:hypothetical protein